MDNKKMEITASEYSFLQQWRRMPDHYKQAIRLIMKGVEKEQNPKIISFPQEEKSL